MDNFLIDALFGGLAAGGLRSPWTFALVSAALWGTAFARPPLLGKLPAGRLWAAWLGWIFLSALASAEPLRGLAACSHSATAVLVFALAAGWERSAKRRWTLYLLGAGVLIGAAALLIENPSRPMVGLLFPHYTYTAAVMAAAFAGALAVFGSVRDRRAKAGLALVMLLSIGLIVAARSRGALLASGAVFLFWLIRRRAWRLLALCLVAGLAVIVFTPEPVLSAKLKLGHGGTWARISIWKSAVAVTNDHPILGQGPGQFERGFLRHQFPAPEGHRPTRFGLYASRAHSELLHAAAETGWPGLLLLLAAIAASLFTTRSSRERDWSEKAAGLACAALAVHSLVDNVMALPALHWLFMSSLAISLPIETGSSEQAPRLRPVFAAGLLLCALSWWPDWAIERRRSGGFRLRGSAGIASIKTALRLAPADAELWAQLARVQLDAGPEFHGAAAASIAQARSRAPSNAVYAVMGAEYFRMRAMTGPAGERRRLWQEVLRSAEIAIEKEPVCAQGWMLLAEARYRLGSKTPAREALNRAAARRGLPLPPNAHQGYERLVLHFDEQRYRFVKSLLR